MRARNIKPGLFKNEVLGAADPLYTIAFQGLWCIADREGRLEDRPVRIRAEVFPYRDVDMDAVLVWLAENGFIRRYQVAGNSYLQINKFHKHQNPHKTEKSSLIPSPSRELTEPLPLINGCRPADSLIPDSLNPETLIPDSLIPQEAQKAPSRNRSSELRAAVASITGSHRVPRA